MGQMLSVNSTWVFLLQISPGLWHHKKIRTADLSGFLHAVAVKQSFIHNV